MKRSTAKFIASLAFIGLNLVAEITGMYSIQTGTALLFGFVIHQFIDLATRE